MVEIILIGQIAAWISKADSQLYINQLPPFSQHRLLVPLTTDPQDHAVRPSKIGVNFSSTYFLHRLYHRLFE